MRIRPMFRLFSIRPTIRLRAAIVLRLLRWIRQPTRRSGVLLIASGGLGDNVLLSRVLPQFMTLARPDERVCLLVRSDAAAASFLFPEALDVKTYDWRRFQRSLAYRWRLSSDLRIRNFRLVVSTDYDRHPLVDDHLVAATGAASLAEAARPSSKFARDVEANRSLYTSLFEPGHQPTHRFVRLAQLANWATGRTAPVPPITWRSAPAAVRRGGPIFLHPFAGDTRKDVKPKYFRLCCGHYPTMPA